MLEGEFASKKKAPGEGSRGAQKTILGLSPQGNLFKDFLLRRGGSRRLLDKGGHERSEGKKDGAFAEVFSMRGGWALCRLFTVWLKKKKNRKSFRPGKPVSGSVDFWFPM